MLSVVNVLGSLCIYIVHSIKSTFSASLSTSEQTIFEEEFKYLIVTSPLFNGTPQFEQSKEIVNPERDENIISNSIAPITQKLIYLGMIISFINLLYMKFVTPLAPCFIYALICYFLYRHDRHVQIRSIHASALHSMHDIILLSQGSDITLHHLFRYSAHDPSLLQKLGQFLSRHFETYIEIVHQLEPLIDIHNLSRLRDMYNVKDEIPSTLLEFDSSKFKLEDIEMIYSFIIWKRREYLLHLLALDVMSNNKSAHYGKNWRQTIRVNHDLVKEYKAFNQNLESTQPLVDNLSKSNMIHDDECWSPIAEPMITDKHSLTMAHKLDVVEKLIQEIQANLFLCRQDTRPLSSGRGSIFVLEKLSKRFQNIDTSIKALSNQWDGLNALLDITGIAEIPSPPTSPKYDTVKRSQSFRYGNTPQSNSTVSRLRRIQSLKLDRHIKYRDEGEL